MTSIYRNTPDSIVWDILPKDFTKNGSFEHLIQTWKRTDFDALVVQERDRVLPFLHSWGKQLHKVCSISVDDLLDNFLKAPSLSGVLYCSHSTVLSESFFNASPEQIAHPTDRVIAKEASTSLPSAKDLTFSFPRKYEFAGFYNSWGFIRIERSDTKGNGAGVLLSVVTLDAEVLTLLKEHGFEHLAHMFNQSWNGAVHDYIHHLALYTNPSFGIGRRSPMSLHGLNEAIDRWGNDMVDTFNYEYWAHRTHRLVTEQMPELNPQQIIKDAKDYFSQVSFLQNKLQGMGYEEVYIQRIGEYLGSVYLWPLHILIHPYSTEMDTIGQFIEGLNLPTNKKRIDEAELLLSGKHCPSDPRVKAMVQTIEDKRHFLNELAQMDDTPLLKGLSMALKSIDFKNANLCFRKSEWLRFKVAITVQRGMYNCWDHQHPVIYRGKPTHPWLVFAEIFTLLEKTLDSYQPYLKSKNSYELSGICP